MKTSASSQSGAREAQDSPVRPAKVKLSTIKRLIGGRRAYQHRMAAIVAKVCKEFQGTVTAVVL